MCMCLCVCGQTDTHTQAHTYTHTHTHTHTHVHTHARTRGHTHTHAYTLGSGGLCSRNYGIMLSWILALWSQNPHITLWHAGIRIHFVVLMEPQSLENCPFFVHVLASGHNSHKIHEYPHTKVSMHARVKQRKRKHCIFYSLQLLS